MQRVSTLFLFLVWASSSLAVNYVFDEFFFSKDTWDSWKLDNPLQDFNPSDLIPKVKESFPGYELGSYNSLDGPKRRLPPSHKASSSGGGPEVDALDDETMVEPAAKAAQCTMCHVLVAVVWSRLTNRIISGESVTASYIKEQLREACDKDAVDTMLRKNTILRMESGGGATSLLFFVVRERRDGGRGVSATEAEEEAVTLSCKTLVKEHGADLADVLMTQLTNYRREALRLLVKHGRDGGNPQDDQAAEESEPVTPGSSGAGTGSGSGSKGHLPRLDGGDGPADDDDDYVDPDDLDEAGDVKKAAGGRPAAGLARAAALGNRRTVRGLAIQVKPGEAECEDLNSMCASWAVSGECQSNPNYMIGTDKHRGHCRKACGVCQPDDVLGGSPILVSELDSVSSALLLAAKNLGCGAGGPCLSGVSGMAIGSGLVKQQQSPQEPKELPPGMKQLPGGFILGKPWWAKPEVQVVPMSERKPVPAADAAAEGSAAEAGSVASGGGDGAAGDGGGGSGTAAPPSHAEVNRVLAPVLAHMVLTIPSDFFIYEYLYKNHTRHFHADRNGDITEDWLLGRFTRESVSLMSSATGEVAGLEELDLLPGSTHGAVLKAHTWPYVKQVYAGGDECVLGGGRRVVRRVEARIACSPDDQIYMLVREPDFCAYTFVIYVPELCALDYYKPRPKGGKAVAAGGGGAAEGGGAGEVKKRRRASGRV